MKIIVKGKPLRYGGKLYRTGDLANVSRQHARVLTALKRATAAPQVAAAKPAAHSASQAPRVAGPHTQVESPPSHAAHHDQQQPHVDAAHSEAPMHAAHSTPAAPPHKFQRAIRDAKAKQPK